MNTKIAKLLLRSFAFLLIGVTFYPVTRVLAQNGARDLALSGSTVADHDFWSITGNPAGFSEEKGFQCGIAAENRFLVSELNRATFAIIAGTNKGNTGLSLSRSGFSLYSENRLAISYAGQLSGSFAAGIELHYTWIMLGETRQSEHYTDCNIGLVFRANENLFLGFQAGNPASFFLNESCETPFFRMGVRYMLSQQLQLMMEADKTLYRPVTWKAGMEINHQEKVFIRAGLSAPAFAFSFGAGFLAGSFRIDLASAYHPILGFSPQISMNYMIKPCKNISASY